MDFNYILMFITGLLIGGGLLFFKLSNAQSIIAALNAQVDAGQKSKEEEAARSLALSQNLSTLNKELVEYQKIEVRLSTEKEQLSQMKATQKAEFKELQNMATSQFKDMANTILKDKSIELQTSAVNPISEMLELFKKQIADLEKETAQRHGSLDNELKSLRTLNTSLHEEASKLTKALSKNKIQGNFGEILLERVLEWGGLSEGVGFERQKHFKDKHGDEKIVDILLKMPQDRLLVIDSKMSLENYKNYIAADDAVVKQEQLSKHIASIKSHIDELAKSGYKNIVENSLDLLVMFIPIEYSYFIALEKDGYLNEYASKKGIVLATPSSLFAIVSSVQHFWTAQKQLGKIREIVTIGQTLYDRLNAFNEEMEKLGNAIDRSRKQFDSSRNKILGTHGLIVSARKLVECGVSRSSQNAIDLLEIQQDILPTLEACAVAQEEDKLV